MEDSSKMDMDAVKIYFPETYLSSSSFNGKKQYIAFGNYCFAQTSGLTCVVTALLEVPKDLNNSNAAKKTEYVENFCSFLSFSLKCLKDDQQFEYSVKKKHNPQTDSSSNKPSLPQATKILGLISFDYEQAQKGDDREFLCTAFRKYCFKKLQRSFWLDLAFRKEANTFLSFFRKPSSGNYNCNPLIVDRRDIFLKNDKKLSIDGHSLQIIYYNPKYKYFGPRNIPCRDSTNTNTKTEVGQPQTSVTSSTDQPLGSNTTAAAADLSLLTNWINNSEYVSYRLKQCCLFLRQHAWTLYSLPQRFYDETESYPVISRYHQFMFNLEVLKHNVLCYLILLICNLFFFKSVREREEGMDSKPKKALPSVESVSVLSWSTVKYYLSLMSSARQFLYKIKLIFRDIPYWSIQLLKFKLQNHYSVLFEVDTKAVFKRTDSINTLSSIEEYYNVKQNLIAVTTQFILDILLANLFYWFIIRGNRLFSLLYAGKDFTSVFSQVIWSNYIGICQKIINHLDWLMGWPAGLKLNRHLSIKMGTYSIQGVAWWVELLSLLVFGERKYLLKQKNFVFVTNALDMMAMDGECVTLLLPTWWSVMGGIWSISGCMFGMTFYFSLFLDLAHIFFAQIYFLFFLHSKIFNFFCSNIVAFWRLFCGRRNNILKKRIDHFQFSTEQLFIGTLFFTVLVFLFPTVCVYFVSMSAFIIIALFFYSVSRIIVVSISLPVIPTLLLAVNKIWGFGGEKQRTDIYLEILLPTKDKNNGIDFFRLNGKAGRSFGEVLKGNYDEIVSLVVNPI